ncbi:unnamed protein product [Macrosiphum euphorbiae]|uniref:Uncharacterized protein n=1 Tax=Macrosiphum euphorbiae TaxID=13131 RepID=A0AAV0XDR4_9HEMI|nr:unnamed protein product [Macrosiphum euphorbiae]
MLKLFFLIATLATLAQSQIAVEWVCHEPKIMGNCTRVPRITDLLQIFSQSSDDGEYGDLHYCPHYIVERHTNCMRTYYNSCYRYMSEFVRDVFLGYLPRTESAKILCNNNRPYKKEFREHMACTRAMLSADDDFEEYMIESEMQYGQLIEDMDTNDKCDVVNCFWSGLITKIRKQCGSKTEKFSRQVLSNLWPVSMLSVDVNIHECKHFESRCTT